MGITRKRKAGADARGKAARLPECVDPQDETYRDMQDFLLAMNSYPVSVAKHPRLSFRQHLCAIIIGRDFRSDEDSSATLRRRP